MSEARPPTPAEDAWLQAAVKRSSKLVPHSDSVDAARYRWLRCGKPLVVVVPTPSEGKPDKKVTISYGPNVEDGYGASLDSAIDAAMATASGTIA